jgi:DNA-binding transcriptional regulator YhcF (GntR family)
VSEFEFEKVYNDLEKYPTVRHIAERLDIHPRTVGKKAAKLREQGVELIDRSAHRAQSQKRDIVNKFNKTVPEYRKPKERNTKNSRVLVISDMHIPYHHPDAVEFLKAIKKKYKPDRIINIGDELDNHAMSYHESDPDTFSAGDELARARKVTMELEQIFPQMDLIESNHGSLYYRKAKTHGIPKEAMVPYNDLLAVGSGWRWHFDLTIKLSNGELCYFHHGKVGDVLTLTQRMGISAVQGHYHNRFRIDFWGNPRGLYWGLQVGCLIDDNALAFQYNKTTTERPIIGCGIILDGIPHLLPLVMDKNGRWTKQLP